MTEGELRWTPDSARAQATQVARFMRFLADTRGRAFDSYDALWRWSTGDLDGFWSAVWDFYEVRSTAPYERVLASRPKV